MNLAPLAMPAVLVRSFSAEDALAFLRAEYGDELAPILVAVGEVESHLNPDAHRQTEKEDSYGWGQVNAPVWGRVPFGRDAGAMAFDRFKAQAISPAMRAAVAGTLAPARSLAARTGARLVDAFDLVWNWGEARAEQLAGDIRWDANAIAARIARLKDDAEARLWKARNDALDAAYRAALAYLETFIVKPAEIAGGFFLLMLVLVLLLVGTKTGRSAIGAGVSGAKRLAA